MGEAIDWATGIPLKKGLLGSMNALEIHHLFPKSILKERKHATKDVNALANYCLLTKSTNMKISNQLPEVYFPEVENKYPGALSSQWIPMDESLWRIENYFDFLKSRSELLATEANQLFTNLYGSTDWMNDKHVFQKQDTTPSEVVTHDSMDEETLTSLNQWLKDKGLPEGQENFEYVDSHREELSALRGS